MQSIDKRLQEFMQVYELRAACSECIYRRSRISYSILSVPHWCAQDLILVRAKFKGHRWRPVFNRPSHPRPRRYEVCWFFKEDAGCVVHREHCTFASSAEEAEVWNLQKQTNLDIKTLILSIHQREKLNEQRRQGDAQSSTRSPSSYLEKLLKEYRQSSNEILIISEHVDDVCVTQDQSLCLDWLQTDGEITWRFNITTERSLEHVALLKTESGGVFSLGDNVKNTPITHITGHHLRSSQSTYELCVCFLSLSPGVYEQWLVFDFDMRPVLLRKLKVRVGEQFHAKTDEDEEESDCAENVSSEHWDRGNRVIVPFFNKREEDELLLSKYKSPQLNLQFSSYKVQSLPLSQNNYRESAHDFLFREEIAEEKIIRRLKVCGLASISELNTSQILAPRRLCAALKVSCLLTPDTPEGLMLNQGVRIALLKITPESPRESLKSTNQVYEAIVLHKAGKEGHIVLELSSKCVSELQLKKDSRCEMEVQFQLDRLWFCQMHQAVDHLPDLHTVLPDLDNCCVPVCTTRQSELNNKQQIALNFILGKCEYSKVAAPFLIYGPFGTGKTHCLASAAIQLALQPKTKVLICTYTNSSADLYVRVHFHPYIANNHSNLKILRIKANKGGASLNATDHITRKYCLYSADGESFTLPTRSHLESHRIIITTTSMARHFRALNLAKDFFSHILIDEASQMLECEALMALGLADKHTRVVLAGDHMQMAPKLFSVSNDKHSDHTLLNRLFHYYQDHSSSIAKKSRIIFNENYRSTAEIVDFVSTHFYVSDGIKAKGDVPSHPKLYPMMFYHVRGECLLNSDSMSWYNHAEVLSVINVIEELVTHWPVQWGEKAPGQICVLSEGQQVKVIRKQIRQNGLPMINVQNLANIQGGQFRVIIITTVHTRDRLLQLDSSCLQFFNDVKALNTAMTRAQSLVVVVGDAGALCCFGKCSGIWKSYIELCISKGSARPDYFNSDVLQQEMSDIFTFQKTEKKEEDEPIPPENDLILKEMIEEYNMDCDSDVEDEDNQKCIFPTCESEDLMKLVRERPSVYKHGELVMETYNFGYVVPYDNPTEYIAIEGRENIGLSFTGDEVVVEIGSGYDESSLTGKVLGVTQRKTVSSTFVCSLEDENDRKHTQKRGKNIFTKKMIPVNRNTTKICICVGKKSHNFIPIWKFDKGNWKITHYFSLHEYNPKDYVFVVQICTWKARCLCPLGNVIKCLPVGTTLEEGLEILKLEFQLVQSPLMQKDASFTAKSIQSDDSNRKILTSLKTFTVDPEGARDLDDAISIMDKKDCYEIGIHIADVASFVPKDSPPDIDAKGRGATFYKHGGEPFVSMFPKHLSNLCSLIKDEVRPAISLIMKVEKDSGKIRDKDFTLSWIKSNKQLSYEEADKMISRYSRQLKFDTWDDRVRVAHHFARTQRKDRLRKSWTYSQPDRHRKPGERQSRLMIEELNIMFNHEMSDYLTKKTKTEFCTPLRCQLPPTAKQLEEILDQHADVIPLSSHLMYRLNRSADQNDTFTNFMVWTAVWEKIRLAAANGDFYKMADLIFTDDIHPQLCPPVDQLNKSPGKAFLIRSLSCEKASVGHYSLHLDSYTHASSPIRRYTDVVLQRLMHSVLNNRPVEYSNTEINQLCTKCERGEDRAQEFESKAESICLAVTLQKQCIYKLAVVTVVPAESESFILSFPFDKGKYPERLHIMYRDLRLKDQPKFNVQQNQMRLTWKKRMYSMSTSKSLQMNLRFCSEIQQSTWYAIVEAVREEQWKDAKSLILTAEVKQYNEATTDDVSTAENICNTLATTDDVADKSKLDSERTSMSEKDHYANFTLNLKAGNTLLVQLASERERSYCTPTVQLLSVTSNFEICVEHMHSPIKCFSKHANRSSKPTYHNVDDYVQIWKPMCEMESAATAIDDSDCVVLEEVHIDWKTSLSEIGTTSSLSGSFSLPEENLKKWAIEFDLAKCFLCIRKRVLHPKSTESNGTELDPDFFTWVAHGVTTQCSNIPPKNLSKKIHFYIKYASMNNPEIKRDTTYTVEVIPKLLPDIRKESAVNNLLNANELVSNIALGHRIGNNGSEPAVRLYELKREHVTAGLPELNESQFKALEQALNGKFTIIQGPPGTGKTVVGAYIVYWFSQLNSKQPQNRMEFKEKNKKEVILYCGPSNKSVDVVAEYLLKFGKKLKLLRIYSRQMEIQEFPYPGSDLQLSQKFLRQEHYNPELSVITLHHRIRKSHNPHAQEILHFDERNRKEPKSITDDEIEEYKKLLNAARLYELERHDVILCTCTAAGSPNLIKSLNARQILIDECAMATEPQTLVPLVNFKPEKVILLGDHKQLRPIIKHKHVQKLGMSRTLFERYISRALLLDTQYRMHEEICRFPSEAYYQGKLKTQVVERASKLIIKAENFIQSKHILFGDIRGDEKSQVVSTARGNENSKVNLKEVNKAVDICAQLISDGKVSQEEIAILSPYNAQVSEIKDKLKERLQGDGDKITVTTITKSQGSEWLYVILSMVRSCPSKDIEHMPSGEWLSKHIGFVGDENQINVGITRAQNGLCILGNQELLNCSLAWRKLLQHYSSHGCVVSADQISVQEI